MQVSLLEVEEQPLLDENERESILPSHEIAMCCDMLSENDNEPTILIDNTSIKNDDLFISGANVLQDDPPISIIHIN